MAECGHTSQGGNGAAPATRRWFAMAAVCYLALLVYGSLVPLRYTPLPRDKVLQRLDFMEHSWAIGSRTDCAANVLMFVPLSYLLLGAWSVKRRWSGRVVGLLVVVPACLAASVAIETSQIFFPPRVPSVRDIAAQLLGTLIGGVVWVVAGRNITRRCRDFWHARRPAGWAGRWLVVYVASLVLINVMPMNVAVRPHELLHKWRTGGIELIPFARVAHQPLARLPDILWNIACYLPVGLLWSVAARRQPTLGRVVIVGLVVAGAIESAQLFIGSRIFSATDIVTGVFGAAVGHVAVGLYRRRAGSSSAAEKRFSSSGPS